MCQTWLPYMCYLFHPCVLFQAGKKHLEIPSHCIQHYHNRLSVSMLNMTWVLSGAAQIAVLILFPHNNPIWAQIDLLTWFPLNNPAANLLLCVHSLSSLLMVKNEVYQLLCFWLLFFNYVWVGWGWWWMCTVWQNGAQSEGVLPIRLKSCFVQKGHESKYHQICCAIVLQMTPKWNWQDSLNDKLICVS